ncbi:MAG: STAS domain-containing protein [Chitinophagales bacterium]|nr:STAS domain-containing protein [Chitinophagales bacterium]
MKFSIDKQDNYTIFSLLEPKLNAVIAPEVKTRFALMNSEGDRYIIFDLSQVSFVDSSGLSAILTGHRLCENADGLFVLAMPSENVQRLIAISQLTDVLNVANTMDEALNSVGVAALVNAIEDNEDYSSEEEDEANSDDL